MALGNRCQSKTTMGDQPLGWKTESPATVDSAQKSKYEQVPNAEPEQS